MDIFPIMLIIKPKIGAFVRPLLQNLLTKLFVFTICFKNYLNCSLTIKVDYYWKIFKYSLNDVISAMLSMPTMFLLILLMAFID